MLNRKKKIIPTDADKFSAADTLEETRNYYGFTSADFAKQIGISELALTQILHRRAFLSPAVASSIQNVTGIPDYLLLQLDSDYLHTHA